MNNNISKAEASLKSIFEKRFSYLMSPLETFIHKQTTASILLIAFSILAFAVANSPWEWLLKDLGSNSFGIILGRQEFLLSINEWISQGLMALFFFLTGLELKREIIAGNLNNIKEIRLICFAALGGIIVPALLYYLINKNHPGQHGWGIPTATDTAFAIGILALFASRISIGLSIFLTALAIFDDIGAIIIITFFYAHKVNILALVLGTIILFVLFLANKVGIRSGWFYFLMGLLLWFGTYKAGIHPTLAGLLLATTIPARTTISQTRFIINIRSLLTRFEQKQVADDVSMLGSAGRHSIISDIGQNVREASTPLQRWEMNLLIPIAIVILPLFALFNAGFLLNRDILSEGLLSPVTLGIIIGLVIGKPVGILSFSYLILKTRLGKLPNGVRFKEIVGISMLAGIGFTMSIFFTTLSFPQDEKLVQHAKLGILIASLLSAFLGGLWIRTQLKVRST